MRMFKSIMAVVALFAVAVSAAGVFPIEENPIPSWSSPSDVCKVISTCDKCPATSTRYCHYKETGDANCCVGKGDQSAAAAPAIPAASMVASIGPIEEDVPKWASDSDVCNVISTCDKCSVVADASYCFYKESGEATCCEKAVAPAAGSPMVAAVLPIEEDPVPSWASASDVCDTTRSCDLCAPSSSQYCHYIESGEAKCCQKAESSVPAGALVASVLPIEEDPVPKWASDSDVCNAITTCDKCSVIADTSYCFYKETGEATCCEKATAAGNTAAGVTSYVASVGPIEEDPVPSWASASDVCLQMKSCDYCEVGDSQYCHYKETGEANCCKRM